LSEIRSLPLLDLRPQLPSDQKAEGRLILKERPINLRRATMANSSKQSTSAESRSSRAIKDDLAKVTAAWEKMGRGRDAIYDYLKAVRDLVHDWECRGRADRKARRALRLRRIKGWKKPEPYAAVIACTSTADIKARSKWARALRYFASRPPKKGSLKSFMKGKGGINGCATLFARRLGRKS
jgi:hypothetical protein